MRHVPLALLLLASAAAPAFADDCAHSAPRSLDLDFAGVKSVRFDVGPHKLRVDAAAAAGAGGTVGGRACASDPGYLERLHVTQERSGDKLVVRLQRDENWGGLTLGKRYAYLQLDAKVPDDVLVQLDVGSGDAWATGASALSADVGSGDVDVRRTRGRVTVKVGSGDVTVEDAGALHVLSVGSGDVEATNVRGDTEVGSIGSGDFSLAQGGGDVRIGSIGSGDADVERISGSVTVDSIGSGDLNVEQVTGSLTLRSKGSGDVSHSGVGGKVDIPRKR